jgi:hypothetical protein
MDDIHRWMVGLIQRWRLGSMRPLVRSLNHHNHHSEAILGVPKWRRCITQHRGGLSAPKGPATPIHLFAERNRPNELTFNRLRSSDQGRPRYEAVDHRAGSTSWSGRTWHIGPTCSTTLLAYKSHLTLAGIEDTPQELYNCPLLYLRSSSTTLVWFLY